MKTGVANADIINRDCMQCTIGHDDYLYVAKEWRAHMCSEFHFIIPMIDF